MNFSTARVVEERFAIPAACVNRVYRMVELPNGLWVLLVLLPFEKAVSAAMCVGVGSNHETTPGVAHLCEHMLFAGTKTHADPREFHHAVFGSGGQLNAFTTGSRTCFQFEVPNTTHSAENHLDTLLHMFSSMFVCPLLSKKSIRREIHAIDDEHAANVTNPHKVLHHGLRLLARETHPFHRFATGSNKTLHPGLRPELKRHFDKFCAASMALVLRGPHSLNQLQKSALLHFSEIPRGEPIVNTSRPPLVTGQCVYIKGLGPRLRFVFPSRRSPYTRALVCLLGDELPHSLCEYLLRYKGFASEVVAHSQLVDEHDLLMVDMELIGEAAHQVGAVVSILFEYFEVIYRLLMSTTQRFLDDWAKTERIMFLHQDLQLPMDEAAEIADNMLDAELAPCDVIKGSSLFTPSSHSFLTHCGQVLSPSNFSLVFVHKSFTPLRFLNAFVSRLDHDPHFDFDYTILPINLRKIHAHTKGPSQVEFPKPNPFLKLFYPRDLKSSTKYPKQPPPASSALELVRSLPALEVWKGPPLPKMAVSFTTHIAGEYTVLQYMALEVICAVVGEEVRFANYPAEQLGFRWGVFAAIGGAASISITALGPREAFAAMFSSLLESFSRQLLDIDAKNVERACDFLRTSYSELLASSGIEKAMAGIYLLMEECAWSVGDRLEALDRLKVADVCKLALEIHDTAKATVLFVNGSQAEANEVEHIVDEFTHHSSYSADSAPFNPSTYLLPPGHFSYEVVNDADDPMNVTLCYYQLGERDSANITLAAFLGHLLGSTAIQELRIKRQLGYDVACGVQHFRKTVGVYVAVLSKIHHPSVLLEQMDDFIHEWTHKLLRLPSQDFRESINKFVAANHGLAHVLQPLRGSSDPLAGKIYETHWQCWEQVSNRSPEQLVDLGWLTRLTQKTFSSMVASTMGEKRASLSILCAKANPEASPRLFTHGLLQLLGKSTKPVECTVCDIEQLHELCSVVANEAYQDYGDVVDDFLLPSPL